MQALAWFRRGPVLPSLIQRTPLLGIADVHNFLNRGRSYPSSQCLYVFLAFDDICLGLKGFCLYFYVK